MSRTTTWIGLVLGGLAACSAPSERDAIVFTSARTGNGDLYVLRDGATEATLLVVGALDEPFLRHGEELLHGLPDARLEVIERAGHATHLEQPSATASVVNAFLATL